MYLLLLSLFKFNGNVRQGAPLHLVYTMDLGGIRRKSYSATSSLCGASSVHHYSMVTRCTTRAAARRNFRTKSNPSPLLWRCRIGWRIGIPRQRDVDACDPSVVHPMAEGRIPWKHKRGVGRKPSSTKRRGKTVLHLKSRTVAVSVRSPARLALNHATDGPRPLSTSARSVLVTAFDAGRVLQEEELELMSAWPQWRTQSKIWLGA
jgi:hypothetical protein